MSSPQPPAQSPFAVLRQFARRRSATAHCELCSADLAGEHEHLIEPASRRLLCCCGACAILFSGRQNAKFRRVPRRVQFLSDFRLTDAQWEELHLPINLAFFFHSSPARRVVAVYPSPAGATESLLTLEAWHELEKENPVLRELEPDVEALLVNRVRHTREHYRVPIDECYKLVGIIRTTWRGLSGGTEVWEAIGQFFANLKERSGPWRETSDA
jgi:Family of unknown function (DUF5947)